MADNNTVEVKAQEAAALLAQYDNFAVATQQEYEGAALVLKEVKARTNELDDMRKSMTRPLDESKKRIMDMFRKPIDTLAAVEAKIKRGLLAYQQEQERKRAEAERLLREQQAKEAARLAKLEEAARERGDEKKADAFAERAAVAAAAPVMIAAPVAKVKGIGTREVWKYEITDADAVPREYLMVDETKIGQVVRATKGTLKIAGVRIYSENTLAASAA